MSRPRDTIEILGLRGVGFHGVFDHERRDGQEFVVDVRITADFSAAAGSDDLTDTIDYGHVGELVLARIVGEPFDLIEKLADVIAVDLAALPGVLTVQVTVQKPHAPMPVPFDNVSVSRYRRGSCRAVIGLGSNLGDRASELQYGLSALAADPATEVAAVSRVYATAPVGGPEQPDYLNAVAVVNTTLDPWQLLRLCQRIEAGAGRERTVRWGPRTLDLDILDFAGQRWADPDLTLPHPRATERAFVLAPWTEVEPDARPGGHGPTVAQLLRALPGDQPVALAPGLRLTLVP